MVHLGISVSNVFVSSCFGFWRAVFCSLLDGKRKQLIRNVLQGRSGEEKTRNRRVAEQVAGSFCYAGLDGSFCIVASKFANLAFKHFAVVSC